MKWDIIIERNDDLCLLGSGWIKIIMDTGLKAGDKLVFYTYESKDNVYVCIIKNQDIVQSKSIAGMQFFTLPDIDLNFVTKIYILCDHFIVI